MPELATAVPQEVPVIANARVAQWTVRAVTRVLAVYAIAQGVNIVLTVRSSWAGSPSLSTALDMPGAPASWGCASIIAGGFALAGSFIHRYPVVAFGMTLCAVWSLFFAITLAVSWLSGQPSPRTGLFTYAALALVEVIVAAAYRTTE